MDHTRRCKTNLCFLYALIMDTNVLNHSRHRLHWDGHYRMHLLERASRSWTFCFAAVQIKFPSSCSVVLLRLCALICENFSPAQCCALKSRTDSSALFFLNNGLRCPALPPILSCGAAAFCPYPYAFRIQVEICKQ